MSAGTVRLGRAELRPLSESELVDHVRGQWRALIGGWIVTVNVDVLLAMRRDPRLRRMTAAALQVADGMPLVWASRIGRQPLPERVTGSSLIFSVSAAAAADGRSVYLLGGAPGIPEEAAAVLGTRIPGLVVAGTASPPLGFDRTSEGIGEVVAQVRDARPDVVFVGMGCPRQELLIAELRHALPAAWFVGCGAAIPMAAGTFRRASPLVQRCGLEWAHRLLLEPRRLARRYLRDDLPFAILLMGAALGRLCEHALDGPDTPPDPS